MAKKVSKKVTEVRTVKVKIQPDEKTQILFPSYKGKQVEMSERDHKYVLEALRRYEKAQQILMKYYGE